MPATLAFDVYGTLIDTHGLVGLLRGWIGDQAEAFSQTWRDKQLEYSFRRGLMQHYADFGVCTRDALQFTCRSFGVELGDAQRAELLKRYRTLPAFAEVPQALRELGDAGLRLFAFSNGSAEAVETLLQAARIREHFIDVVSVDEMRSYKPNPAVYAHFLRRAGATGATAWLISGNPFDVIGAISAGMRGVWVRRSPAAVFDPWGIEPDLTVTSLLGLGQALQGRAG